MNTDANLVGKGNYANLTEQTAQNATQAAKNQAETKQTYQAVSSEMALLNTVRNFFDNRAASSIIETVNDLTRDWLELVLESNQDADRDSFSKDYVADSLFVMNKITEFIAQLQQCESDISVSNEKAVNRMQEDLITAYEEQISLSNQLAEAREQTINLLEERVSLLIEKGESDPQT